MRHVTGSPDITIRPAAPGEAATIADLTRRAFRSQCELYGIPDLPPMSDTAESVTAAMGAGVVLVALDGERVVGSVRGELSDGVCLVGRLVVEPDAQGAGIGRALAESIETRFPEAARFEIFTGHRSAGPLHLYESLGYVPERTEPVAPGLDLVFLGKPGPSRTSRT